MAYIEILHEVPLLDEFINHTLKGKQFYLVDVRIDDVTFDKALKQGFDPKLHEVVNKGTKLYVLCNNTKEYIHYSDLKQ